MSISHLGMRVPDSHVIGWVQGRPLQCQDELQGGNLVTWVVILPLPLTSVTLSFGFLTSRSCARHVPGTVLSAEYKRANETALIDLTSSIRKGALKDIFTK